MSKLFSAQKTISDQGSRSVNALSASPLESFSQTAGRSLRVRASEPGNKRSTALDLGRFPKKSKIQETVGSKDTDIYKITIGGTGTFQAKLTLQNRSERRISVSFLDNLGNVIRQSGTTSNIEGGVTVEQSYKRLAPGTYFVRIRSGGSNNKYRLTVDVPKSQASDPSCGCGG